MSTKQLIKIFESAKFQAYISRRFVIILNSYCWNWILIKNKKKNAAVFSPNKLQLRKEKEKYNNKLQMKVWNKLLEYKNFEGGMFFYFVSED